MSHNRPRRAAQVPSYREPVYDSDYESLPEKKARPSRHSARLKAAYSGLSDTDTSADALSEIEKPPPAPQAKSLPSRKRHAPPTTVRMEGFKGLPFREFKRRKTVHDDNDHLQATLAVKVKAVPRRSVSKSTTNEKAIPQEITPPWQNLEYQILSKIMKYAAYPLYTGASHDTGSTAWLLKTSTLCRSFHEAALGALLYSPPLFPASRAHAITELLKRSRQEFGEDMSHPKKRKGSRISMDYRRMVRQLCIEARHVLVSKAGVSLADLVRNTPNLKSLVIYHNHDFVSDKVLWARPDYAKGKAWQYSQMYPVLAELPHFLHLQDFEWNARFLTKSDASLSQFHEFHDSSVHVQRLKSITLRNFIIDGVEKLNETVVGSSVIGGPESKPTLQQTRLMTWRRVLRDALSKSKELKQLSICSSNIFDSASTAMLPNGLERLEIENCPCINSEGLESYLSDRGGQLKELILKGNQYMSLEFSTMLKEYTPLLSVLDVDLTYTDPTSYQDTEPLYDSLLPNGPPSWPEGLERISVGPLRKLSAEDANDFYQSLIDSAGQLTYLRVLELRTLLNEAGWRDRAALRTKWTAKFDAVFNIKCNAKVKPPRAEKLKPKRANKVKSSRTDDFLPRRQSQRIADLEFVDSQSDPPSPTYSNLLDTYRAGDENAADGEPLVRRGRCHTVTFELSDQRPAQEQFKEDDFLDDADLQEDSDYRDG